MRTLVILLIGLFSVAEAKCYKGEEAMKQMKKDGIAVFQIKEFHSEVQKIYMGTADKRIMRAFTSDEGESFLTGRVKKFIQLPTNYCNGREDVNGAIVTGPSLGEYQLHDWVMLDLDSSNKADYPIVAELKKRCNAIEYMANRTSDEEAAGFMFATLMLFNCSRL